MQKATARKIQGKPEHGVPLRKRLLPLPESLRCTSCEFLPGIKVPVSPFLPLRNRRFENDLRPDGVRDQAVFLGLVEDLLRLGAVRSWPQRDPGADDDLREDESFVHELEQSFRLALVSLESQGRASGEGQEGRHDAGVHGGDVEVLGRPDPLVPLELGGRRHLDRGGPPPPPRPPPPFPPPPPPT